MTGLGLALTVEYTNQESSFRRRNVLKEPMLQLLEVKDVVQPGKAYQVSEDSVTTLNHQGFTSEIDIDYFWNKIYIPFLTNIVVNLEDRFPDLPLLQKFEVFNTRKFFGEEPTCRGEDDIKEDKTSQDNINIRGKLHDF
ncbi:hypothetical protein MAR_032699 [Mya arenaria]|uniref:Uncharacterized protein n=1 Tax=Mya arenaria TaxID=6604 RepID=A0ABY7F7L2_MYAAR|nr:hypothetical protein MAR_032699 [Mya arenaria]